MSQLFSHAWMKQYQAEWNRDSELTQSLKQINFCSSIGYGFPDEKAPRGLLIVQQGRVVEAGSYQGQTMNWDLRAQEKHWLDWLNREMGATGFGLAYSTGKLKFIVGDYKSMVKKPEMARPFIKSFSAMARACTFRQPHGQHTGRTFAG